MPAGTRQILTPVAVVDEKTQFVATRRLRTGIGGQLKGKDKLYLHHTQAQRVKPFDQGTLEYVMAQVEHSDFGQMHGAESDTIS